MLKHVRAMLGLFILTLVVCCVLYPLALWAVGRAVFPSRAAGSLVVEDGEVRGSRLIAQPFEHPKYFKPRPSAVGYNGAGSGGSNLAASNPLLRDRVARELGKIAKFDDGKRVGPEVQKWFIDENKRIIEENKKIVEENKKITDEKKKKKEHPALLGKWAAENKTLAKRWVTEDDDRTAAVRAWLVTQRDLLPEGKSDAEKLSKDDVGELGGAVLQRFAKLHPTSWPATKKQEVAGDKPTFSLAAEAVGADDNADLQSVLFDYWLTAHPEQSKRIKKVPADLVLASGSGLDPHVSMKAARYQLPEVVEARAAETKLGADEVKRRIEAILEQHSFRAFGFLGEPLVNVLEVNLAMDSEFRTK